MADMEKKVKTAELYDCETPYLKELFDNAEYPWEMLSKIKAHILSIIENGINGFLYDNNDIDKLTSTINSFIDGSIEYEKFTGISVEQYDCNVIADKLYSILTEN